MVRALALFLGTSLLLFSFAGIVNARGTSVDNFLLSEENAVTGKTDENQKIYNQKSKEEINIEDLLGPKDIFPFLPDNHRDSGTGKFNSF